MGVKKKPVGVIIADFNAFGDAEIKKLEAAGYLVVKKSPGREVVFHPNGGS